LHSISNEAGAIALWLACWTKNDGVPVPLAAGCRVATVGQFAQLLFAPWA